MEEPPFKIWIAKGKLHIVADVRELINYLLIPVKRRRSKNQGALPVGSETEGENR